MDKKKVLVLGVDGLDPRLASHFLEEGKMPSFEKLIHRGSANHYTTDVDLIGHRRHTGNPWDYLLLGTIQKGFGNHDLQLKFQELPCRANVECNHRSRIKNIGMALAGVLMATKLR